MSAKTKTEEIISIREFARRMCVDDKIIRRAISDKKIKKGLSIDGKIIYNIALRECENNLVGKQKKNIEQPIESNIEHAIEIIESKKKDSDHSDITYAEAKKRNELAKARKAELELMELEGDLIRKDKVYASLYEYASVIKNNLLSIPDRITDELISNSHSRSDFYNILNRSIVNELEILSNPPELK